MAVDSKQRLLDSAEELFARQGFHATSLRQITAQAGVNLAAVNYHFGSKDGLIAAVFEHYVQPVNDERLRQLDAVEAARAQASLEDIVRAFVAPPFRFDQSNRDQAKRSLRLYARIHTSNDSHLHHIFVRQFDAVRRRFTAALARALPAIPEDELHWRMHFVIATMAQTMADPERLVALSDGRCDPYDADATLARLVPFLVAGLQAETETTTGVARTRRAGARQKTT